MAESGSVRQPRAWLMVAGSKVNLTSCEVTQVALGQTSQFEAKAPLDDPENPDANSWSTIDQSQQIQVVGTNGDGQSGEKTLLTGAITKVSIDFFHRVVTVEGTDRTQELIDTRSDEAFPPHFTTMQVAEAVAGKTGFGFESGGQSFQYPGSQAFGHDFQLNSDYESYWDVLQYCAVLDGVKCFVHNSTIYYIDPSTGANGSDYQIKYAPPTSDSFATGNVLSLECTHDPGADSDAGVTSFNIGDKASYGSGDIQTGDVEIGTPSIDGE